MSPRASALCEVLHRELIRVGRPDVGVILGGDERSVTLTDADGTWEGPVPVAYGTLAVCADGEGGTAQFWQHFVAGTASA